MGCGRQRREREDDGGGGVWVAARTAEVDAATVAATVRVPSAAWSATTLVAAARAATARAVAGKADAARHTGGDAPAGSSGEGERWGCLSRLTSDSERGESVRCSCRALEE